MTIKSNWLNDTKKQLDLLKDTLSGKDYKKYRLHLLYCLTERVAQFSDVCGQCQIFQNDISALIQDISNLIRLPNKQRQKSYFKSISNIVNHFQKQHKLVSEGYYMGLGIAIGSGLGVAFGAAFEQFGGGMPIGIGIGIAIGAVLDNKAKKEGRILCPKETSEATPAVNFKVIAIILGLLLLTGAAAFFYFRQSG